MDSQHDVTISLNIVAAKERGSAIGWDDLFFTGEGFYILP
jgi:hypothetical protein